MSDIQKEIDETRGALVRKHGAALVSTATMHTQFSNVAMSGAMPNGMLALLALGECVAARLAELGKTVEQYGECCNDVQRSATSLLELTRQEAINQAISGDEMPLSQEVAQALHNARRL